MTADKVTISEKPSEIKGRRGRPRSLARQVADAAGVAMKPDCGKRTNINAAYGLSWMRIWRDAGPEAQRRVFGVTHLECLSGAKPLPPGWATMSESIGRALDAGAIGAEDALRIVIDARERGLAYGTIAAHFRKLRLGEKIGNSIALTMALARALDRYQRQFPATTQRQRRAAVQDLLDTLTEQEGAE